MILTPLSEKITVFQLGLVCLLGYYLIMSYLEGNTFNLILRAGALWLNLYILGQRIKGINIG